MLSNDDIDRLLAIGAEQRAKLLGERPDRVLADEGPEGDAQGDDALASPL
jgi:hypothetical protein